MQFDTKRSEIRDRQLDWSLAVAHAERRPVTVIATPGNHPAALAAKASATTIPIVFNVGDDRSAFSWSQWR